MDRHQPSTRSVIPPRSPVFGSVPCESSMRLSICSTTGSRFELSVPQGETLEGLRRRLSQRLRVPKDRLVFLHKETQLSPGKLLDQGVSSGSKLTLVPAVEAGLTSQMPKTEQTMMQALENLTETQVSDFLSGRSPLTLALGIGAHMMYVQLQLASQNAAGQPQSHISSRNGGKMHSGKSGSSRVPRPYPSPSHPPYVSHSLSPTHNPQAPSPASPTSPLSPSSSPTSHSIPVISPPHPGTVSSPPHAPRPQIAPLSHTPSPGLSTPSLLSSRSPPPCLTLLPAAPLCSPHLPCSSPAPQSPAPASTYPEEASSPASARRASREPGAVIESFVSHSPGVFSGTFSGTLPSVSQTGISHPRRGISTILQILNDLLSATRHHQGAPPSLCQLRSPAPASRPPTPDPTTSRATSEPALTSSTHPGPGLGSSSKPTADSGGPQQSSSEENRVLRRKLESLQLLMQQRRLHRRARRSMPSSHASTHPYSQRHRHPWSPGQRKAARRHSNSSLSGSEGTSQDDIDAEEVMEESPWKPELTSDLVVA